MPLDWLLVMAVAVCLASGGCSDPPDPVPLQKLSSVAGTANRLVVAASGDYADPTFKPVEIKGAGKGAEFLTTLEFSSKRRFYHSPLHGEYRIQCFSNDQQLVAITLPGYRPATLAWEIPDSSNGEGTLNRSSLNTLLGWLATNGCDILKREKAAEDAEKQRRRQAELNCVACFPPQVHELFKPAPYGTEIPPWATKRGHKLAAAINDPVRLTTMVCKGFGCLREYDYFAEHEQILEAAIATVSGPDLGAGLRTIEHDRDALLGASRFLFRSENVFKLPETDRGFWTATLSEVVLTSGLQDESVFVFRILSKDASPEILDLLRRVVRNGTGRTYKVRGMQMEPLPIPSAYLCLAIHGATEVKPEIETLLPATTRPLDRTALELALALLSETNHVRPENFQIISYLLADAACKAVDRFPNQENLDALVYGSFTPPDHHAWQMDQTAALFERLVRNHWPATARYNGEIKQWWDANKSKFPKAGTRDRSE